MKISSAIKVALLVVISAFYLFPLYWTLITSLKIPTDIFTSPPVFLPIKITLSNFFTPGSIIGAVSQTAVGSIPWMIDSSVVAGLATLASTFLIGAPSAYALTRLMKRGLWLGRLVLFMTLIPEAAMLVPFYLIVIGLHLLNTWWGLMLVYLSFTAPFATWLMMGFFNDVPKAVEESASIDGLSSYQIFYKISLRLVTPGLVAAIILSFISCWNELLYALVLTYSPFPGGAQTVPVFISGFIIIEKGFAWGGLAAAGIFTMLPTLVLGVLAQKYMARGLTLGAVKG